MIFGGLKGWEGEAGLGDELKFCGAPDVDDEGGVDDDEEEVVDDEGGVEVD